MPFGAYSDLIDTLTPSKMHFENLMLFITPSCHVTLWGA